MTSASSSRHSSSAVEMEVFPPENDGEDRSSQSIEEVKDLESQELIRKKHYKGSCFGRIFQCYETPMQCPNLTCAAFSTCMTVASAIAIIVGYVLVNNNTSSTDTRIGYVLIIGGSVLAANFLLNCGAHIFGSCAVKHYIPQQAFEKNIGQYAAENTRLEKEIEILKTNANRFDGIAEGQKKFSELQEEITKNVNRILEERTAELASQRQQTQDVVTRLEGVQAQAAADRVQFEQDIQKVHEVISSLVESSNRQRELLVEAKIIGGDYKKAGEEWKENIGERQGEHNEQREQNLKLAEIMRMGREGLESNARAQQELQSINEKLREHVDRIDESDDKLLEAARRVEQALKEKECEATKNKALKEQREQEAKIFESCIKGIGDALSALCGKDQVLKDKLQPVFKVIDKMLEDVKTETLSEMTITEVDDLSEKE